jgi:hypothetical protein
MLDIGKTNLFLNENSYVVSRIINYYDLMCRNCLFLDGVDSNIHVKCSKITVTSNNISELLINNLFRVDIIIATSMTRYDTLLSKIREVTDLPVILITDNFIYSEKDLQNFDFIYRLYKIDDTSYINFDYENKFLEKSRVNDIKNSWDMSLADIKKQYIREEKINKLL